ncbi:T9SS type A sorting domain-containing protein [Flavobacterium sp.]|uniref:T9SS type A sorting domain-containing protein n=1 Tax=Flavobacterium sp. TaxID=239 RepID=UPI002FDE34D8
MKKLLTLILMIGTVSFYAQTISIVGTGVNGWPPTNGPEITLSTTDNITYTINNLAVTTGFVKFRQDYGWTVNWGGSTFPNGQGVQNGPDIPTVAGTYDVTFNRINGTYTFIGTAAFPSIGIWGPAVDSQNGYAGPDVDMITSDGITYTLSGFNFSSGNAYFRQDNATNFVWGAVAFPSGTAVLSGPPIPVTGGEYFVTFNRNTGAFSFEFPSVGILGNALNGWDVADTDLATTNGFNYSISNLTLSNGFVKFRKDNSWSVNWGNVDFPSGTGVQGGPDIPVTAGTYDITFERTSGNYTFTSTLTAAAHRLDNLKIYPNPSANNWTFLHTTTIDSVQLFDISGKVLQSVEPNATEFELSGNELPSGVYFVKIKSGLDFSWQKIIKN